MSAAAVQRPTGGWIAAVVLPLVTLFAYGNGVNNTYVEFDDLYFLSQNPVMHDPQGWRRVWDVGDPQLFYPLTWTLHWVSFQVFGDRPGVFLLINALLHAANAVLVFFLTRRLTASALAAWTAGLLFVLHPMQVVAVAWLASTKNVLSTFFVLLAMLAWLRWRLGDGPLPVASGGAAEVRPRLTGSAGWYAAALVCMAAALLSKTAVVTAAGSLLLLDWLVLRRGWRASFATLPIFVAGVALALVTAGEEWAGQTAAEPLPERPLAAAWAFWFYLGKLLLPIDLKTIYPKIDFHYSPVHVALLVGALLAPVVVWLNRKRMGHVAVWGLAHFALSVAPILGLLQFGYLTHGPVSDHFVYLGSVGIFLCAGIAVRALHGDPAEAETNAGRARIATALPVLVCLPLTLLTTQRVAAYRGPVEFWSHTSQNNPGYSFAREILAERLNTAGKYREALPMWEEFLGRDPNSALFLEKYGVALFHSGRVSEAQRAFERALEIDPNRSAAAHNLASLEASGGNRAAAIRWAQHAVERDPNLAEAFALLASLLGESGAWSEALPYAEKAAELAPSDAWYQFTLAYMRWQLGMPEEAQKAAARAEEVAIRRGDDATLRETRKLLDDLRSGRLPR